MGGSGYERRKVERLHILIELSEIGLLVGGQPTERLARFADRETGKFDAVLDVLDILTALLKQVDHRHHAGHDRLPEHKIPLLHARAPERDMLSRQEVGRARNPAVSAPEESVE